MRFLPALLLVVLATVVAPFVIATAWLTSQVDDRQEYVDAVAPLADDARVQRVVAGAIAEGVADALRKNVPVGLPDAIDEVALAAATEVTESRGFPEFWREANRSLHGDVLPILEDADAPTDGYLTVDAAPLVAQVLLLLEDRGVPVDLLPEVQVQVPVVEKSTVAEGGSAYRAAHTAGTWLPVAWALFVAAALLIARGWRGRLRIAGLAALGVAAAAVLVMSVADTVAEKVVARVADQQVDLSGLMVDTLVRTLPDQAGPYLWWSLPIGLVLIAGSMWPRREPSADQAPPVAGPPPSHYPPAPPPAHP